MDLIQKLKDQVKPLGKKIVLPEYKDERVLKATEIILKQVQKLLIIYGLAFRTNEWLSVIPAPY